MDNTGDPLLYATIALAGLCFGLIIAIIVLMLYVKSLNEKLKEANNISKYKSKTSVQSSTRHHRNVRKDNIPPPIRTDHSHHSGLSQIDESNPTDSPSYAPASPTDAYYPQQYYGQNSPQTFHGYPQGPPIQMGPNYQQGQMYHQQGQVYQPQNY